MDERGGDPGKILKMSVLDIYPESKKLALVHRAKNASSRECAGGSGNITSCQITYELLTSYVVHIFGRAGLSCMYPQTNETVNAILSCRRLLLKAQPFRDIRFGILARSFVLVGPSDVFEVSSDKRVLKVQSFCPGTIFRCKIALLVAAFTPPMKHRESYKIRHGNPWQFPTMLPPPLPRRLLRIATCHSRRRAPWQGVARGGDRQRRSEHILAAQATNLGKPL